MMTENYQLETARANIVTVVTKMPKGVSLADFQEAYLETVGSHLNPTMLGFENVETLLNSMCLLKMLSNLTMMWMSNFTKS